MRMPSTKGNPNFNRLRGVVRAAMNEVKQLEWSDLPEEAYAATVVWDKLDKLFKRLGNFVEES